MTHRTFGGEPPEKPECERESLTFTSLDVTFESASNSEQENIREYDPGEGHVDPLEMKETLREAGPVKAKLLWKQWMTTLFSHRFNPDPLFKYETVEKAGVEAPVAHKDVHGRSERPVLELASQGRKQLLQSAKSVCMQYAATSEKPPQEVCKEIPFDIFPTEVWRLREFVEEHGMVWTVHNGRPWWDRTPIAAEYRLQGVVYFMYTVSDNEPVPRYIGLSRRDNTEGDGLNYGFANATSDSVMTRWGYGKGQHAGELSCAMWPDEYSWKPKTKYQNWLDELFVDQTRVMKEPLYIEVLPWLSDSPIFGEENLIMLADKAFDETLLNVEYAGRFTDEEQKKLT